MVSSGAELETQWGPMYMREGLPDVALQIRKPDLLISKDWKLELSMQ